MHSFAVIAALSSLLFLSACGANKSRSSEKSEESQPIDPKTNAADGESKKKASKNSSDKDGSGSKADTPAASSTSVAQGDSRVVHACETVHDLSPNKITFCLELTSTGPTNVEGFKLLCESPGNPNVPKGKYSTSGCSKEVKKNGYCETPEQGNTLGTKSYSTSPQTCPDGTSPIKD